MLLVIPAVSEKCLLYTFQLAALSSGWESSSLLASLPLHGCSGYEQTPQFHTHPANGQQETTLLVFCGLSAVLGHLN